MIRASSREVACFFYGGVVLSAGGAFVHIELYLRKAHTQKPLGYKTIVIL